MINRESHFEPTNHTPTSPENLQIRENLVARLNQLLEPLYTQYNQLVQTYKQRNKENWQERPDALSREEILGQARRLKKLIRNPRTLLTRLYKYNPTHPKVKGHLEALKTVDDTLGALIAQLSSTTQIESGYTETSSSPVVEPVDKTQAPNYQDAESSNNDSSELEVTIPSNASINLKDFLTELQSINEKTDQVLASISTGFTDQSDLEELITSLNQLTRSFLSKLSDSEKRYATNYVLRLRQKLSGQTLNTTPQTSAHSGEIRTMADLDRSLDFIEKTNFGFNRQNGGEDVFLAYQPLLDYALSLSGRERQLALEKIIKSEFQTFVRIFQSHVEYLENNNASWTQFDKSYFDNAIFNPLNRVVLEAQQCGLHSLSRDLQDKKELLASKLFGYIKGIHGYWVGAGSDMLHGKGSGDLLVRHFPEPNTALLENLALGNGDLTELISSELSVGNLVVNKFIGEHYDRLLSTAEMSQFNLNVAAERELGSDFLDRVSVVPKTGESVSVRETGIGWCMRQFDRILSYKGQHGEQFIDPKTNRPIDALEIHNTGNTEALIDYVHRKAQAYGLPIDEQMVRRSLRLYIPLTINHVILSPGPTRVSDKIFQTYRWGEYLAKEIKGGTRESKNLPAVDFYTSVFGWPGWERDHHPLTLTALDLGFKSDWIKKVLSNLLVNKTIKRNGFRSWLRRSPTDVKTIQTGRDNSDRPVYKVVNAEGSMSFIFNNFPLVKDKGEFGYSFLPPLGYYTDKKRSRRFGQIVTLEDVRDNHGRFLYEAMDFSDVSLGDYYSNFGAKVLGFTKDLLWSNWSDFNKNVIEKSTTTLKDIQYSMDFFAEIGKLKKAVTLGVRSGTPWFDQLSSSEQGRLLKKYEDVIRFMAVLTYVINNLRFLDESKWSQNEVNTFLRNFFRDRERFFKSGEFTTTDASKTISAIADSLITASRRMLVTFNEALEHATKGLTRSA